MKDWQELWDRIPLAIRNPISFMDLSWQTMPRQTSRPRPHATYLRDGNLKDWALKEPYHYCGTPLMYLDGPNGKASCIYCEAGRYFAMLDAVGEA